MTAAAGAGGPKLFGRYELIAEIAKGQLGPLWVAHSGPELVAIRRVRTGPPMARDQVDRLSEAAWWALEVRHDNLAMAIDVVMTEGELGFVSRYVAGEPLRSVLRLSSFRRKPIPFGSAMRIGLDVSRGLRAAYHEAQPLSRGSNFASGGINPDSVLVGADGSSMVLDLGVAAVIASVPSFAHFPELAAYTAPEVLGGGTCDPRSDVFAVGVLLWEMITGKRLFVGSSHTAVADKVKTGAIARLDASKPIGGDAVPKEVADIVARALEREPDARFPTIGDLVEALTALGDDVLAPYDQVAKVIDDLAGSTIIGRTKLVERALEKTGPTPSPPAAAATVSKPAAQPAAAKPAAQKAETPPAPAAAPIAATPAAPETAAATPAAAKTPAAARTPAAAAPAGTAPTATAPTATAPTATAPTATAPTATTPAATPSVAAGDASAMSAIARIAAGGRPVTSKAPQPQASKPAVAAPPPPSALRPATSPRPPSASATPAPPGTAAPVGTPPPPPVRASRRSSAPAETKAPESTDIDVTTDEKALKAGAEAPISEEPNTLKRSAPPPAAEQEKDKEAAGAPEKATAAARTEEPAEKAAAPAATSAKPKSAAETAKPAAVPMLPRPFGAKPHSSPPRSKRALDAEAARAASDSGDGAELGARISQADDGRRRRTRLIIGAGIGAVVLVVIGLATMGGKKTPEPEPAAAPEKTATSAAPKSEPAATPPPPAESAQGESKSASTSSTAAAPAPTRTEPTQASTTEPKSSQKSTSSTTSTTSSSTSTKTATKPKKPKFTPSGI